MSESFEGKCDTEHAKRSNEFGRGLEDFSAIYLGMSYGASPQQQGRDTSGVVSSPAATSSPASQQTRTDGPNFKDQVMEVLVPWEPGAQQSSPMPTGDRNVGPNFTDHGMQEGALKPGVQAVSRRASRKVTGPEYKDQVRVAAKSDAKPALKADYPQSHSPEFKDQVRNAQQNCDGHQTEENPTITDRQQEWNEASIHEDDPDHVSMPDDPLLQSEGEYPSNSGTPMLEAELVNSIVAAQVVEEKLLRRNVCLLIIGLNLLLAAGLGAGGYCLISEECKRELGDDAQNLLIPSSSTSINYNCNIQMEVNCQNTAGIVCSEVKRTDPSSENATATANECQDDFRYNVSILNLEEDSLRVTSLQFFRPDSVAVDLNADKMDIEISPKNGYSVVYSVSVDVCQYFIETLAWASLEASLRDEQVCGKDEGVFIPTDPPTLSPSFSPTGLSSGSIQPTECRIETSVTCFQSDSTPCSSIVQHEVTSCSVDSITALEFRYVAVPCHERSSKVFECMDYAFPLPLLANDVAFECFSEEGIPLVVTRVRPLETHIVISASDGGILPGKIRCFLFSSVTLLQRISFESSVFDNLKEGHVIGALQFLSCGDAMCRGTIYHNTTVSNLGSSEINITNLHLCNKRCLDYHLTDPSLLLSPLLPGESYSSIGSFTFDNCFEKLGLEIIIDKVEAVALTTGETCGYDELCGTCLPVFSPVTIGPTPEPTPTPATAVDNVGDSSSEDSKSLIFGLVALGVALELLLCLCVYMCFKRWKHRRDGTLPKRSQNDENKMVT